MEAFAEIEHYKKTVADSVKTESNTRIASQSIVETDQKSFQIVVPAKATRAETRAALYELAVMRWKLHTEANEESISLEDSPELPPIFSYLDENDATVYFFNSFYSAIPRGWNELTHPHVFWTNEVPDNKVKIPITKLPTVAAKKLFNRD